MPMIVPPPQSQSPTSASLPPRPRGLVRIAVRLPILLYWLGLGWLLGHRFLLLTHRGRVSGQVRHTVLEVIRHDRAADAVLAWYERHRPRALGTFSRVLCYPYDGTPAGRRAMATALPMVSFRRL
jgi:hypothetical protein